MRKRRVRISRQGDGVIVELRVLKTQPIEGVFGGVSVKVDWSDFRRRF